MIDSQLSPPRIVCAANRHPHTQELAVGARHFCPVMRRNIESMCKAVGAQVMGQSAYAMAWRTSEQGFIDQHGRFYNRDDAWKIADANGQIFRDRDWQTGNLHSEHLY